MAKIEAYYHSLNKEQYITPIVHWL